MCIYIMCMYINTYIYIHTYIHIRIYVHVKCVYLFIYIIIYMLFNSINVLCISVQKFVVDLLMPILNAGS